MWKFRSAPFIKNHPGRSWVQWGTTLSLLHPDYSQKGAESKDWCHFGKVRRGFPDGTRAATLSVIPVSDSSQAGYRYRTSKPLGYAFQPERRRAVPTCGGYNPSVSLTDRPAGRVLGLDVGSRRIGMAVTDPLGITAQGIETLQRRNKRTDFAALERVIHEYEVREIVVGLP